jgi:hypothetical protein
MTVAIICLALAIAFIPGLTSAYNQSVHDAIMVTANILEINTYNYTAKEYDEDGMPYTVERQKTDALLEYRGPNDELMKSSIAASYGMEVGGSVKVFYSREAPYKVYREAPQAGDNIAFMKLAGLYLLGGYGAVLMLYCLIVGRRG